MFVIGLLKQVRTRIEATARRKNRYVSAVYADIGAMGTARLLPIDSDAVHSFRHYLDGLPSYEDAHVLVLPYAPIPEDLEAELQTVEAIGGLVVRPRADSLELPKPERRPDTTFHNSVFEFIAKQLAPDEDEPARPSQYFMRIAEKNLRLLIADEALESCDDVPQYRWPFLTNAADAFALLLNQHGDAGGRLDAFFRARGLDHAQSGGVSATLHVRKNGECVYEKTSSTHLKQGDNTTPTAATRIYYHLFTYDNNCYVAILHAGSHPDRDINRHCELLA